VSDILYNHNKCELSPSGAMRQNEGTVIMGSAVALVPYLPEHVDRYHAWMLDPWLREMTASEPLSIEEEVEMQRSWHADDDKLTFIVLDLGLMADPGDRAADGARGSAVLASAVGAVAQCAAARVSAMVGDVNLFFNGTDDEGEEDRGVCEVEVMLAEPAARRRGLGTEAVQLLLGYAAQRCAVRRFYCKIGDANTASIAMFKRLGFAVCNHVAAFEETELELLVPGEAAAAGSGATEPVPFEQAYSRASVHEGVAFEFEPTVAIIGTTAGGAD